MKVKEIGFVGIDAGCRWQQGMIHKLKLETRREIAHD
ncbi:MAG: hypothetical protein QOH39_2369 [Verrucomicrobiota bacterium]|jgi:hypothetical protein